MYKFFYKALTIAALQSVYLGYAMEDLLVNYQDNRIKKMTYSVSADYLPPILEFNSKKQKTNVTFSRFSLRVTAGAPESKKVLFENIPLGDVSRYPHLAAEKAEHDKQQLLKLYDKNSKYEPYQANAFQASRSVLLNSHSIAKAYTYKSSGHPVGVDGPVNFFALDSIHGVPFEGQVSIILSYTKTTRKKSKRGDIVTFRTRMVGGYSQQKLLFEKLSDANKMHVHIDRLYVSSIGANPEAAVDFRLLKQYKGTKLSDYQESDSIQAGGLNRPSKYSSYEQLWPNQS